MAIRQPWRIRPPLKPARPFQRSEEHAVAPNLSPFQEMFTNVNDTGSLRTAIAVPNVHVDGGCEDVIFFGYPLGKMQARAAAGRMTDS